MLVLSVTLAVSLAAPIDGEAKSRTKRQTIGLNIDPAVVRKNVFAPNNIATHVTQNTINMIASTLAWSILGSLSAASGEFDTARAYNVDPYHQYQYYDQEQPWVNRNGLTDDEVVDYLKNVKDDDYRKRK